MQRLEVSGVVRLIYRSLGVKGLIKVKSCDALVRMLPVCISIYLKWVPRCQFLILSMDARMRCYFSKPKGPGTAALNCLCKGQSDCWRSVQA